ncbi:MAG: alpha/beta hydrolase [Hyphomicrobiales bacterium]|nr:MAG: alpha/beta hydrolase [Hyphomicrobiales bacterium]
MVEKRFTTDDGVGIVYDDVGSGAPVVLCHGLGAAGEQLAADAEYFAARGFRVLVPDLRGHGRSGKPVRIGRSSFAISRLAQDLLDMVDHAAVGPVHWVGNSLGGILALQLLAGHEARFRTLATFGTSYRLKLALSPGWTLPWVYRLFGRRLTGWSTALATTRNKGARPLIARLVGQFDPLVGAAVLDNLGDYDLIANGVAARLPILMLRGGQDRAVNAALGPTLAAMSGRPNFSLVEVPGGGHCANLDATDEVRRELEAFWGRARR